MMSMMKLYIRHNIFKFFLVYFQNLNDSQQPFQIMELFITFFCVLIGLIYIWIRKRYLIHEKIGFPHDKPVFPFGNMKDVNSKIHMSEKLQEYYQKYKKISPAFGMYFFFNANVVVTDLELVKNVLVRDFDNFRNRGLYYNVKDDPLTEHLFLIEDGLWKNMRTKLTPTFTSGKMKMMFTTMVEISKLMIRNLEAKINPISELEMKDEIGKYSTDVVGNIAFGLELNSLEGNSKFREMSKKLFSPESNFPIKAFLYTSFRSLALKLGGTIIQKDLATFFYNSIEQTVDYRLKNNIERNDVMQLLIKLMNSQDENEKITFNQLAAQCFVFFNAGKFNN
jgi:cytochrome P450 family 6